VSTSSKPEPVDSAGRVILPTLGRIVHYNDAGTYLAAMVTAADGKTSTVTLTVFRTDGTSFAVATAPYGDVPGSWSWPTRIL
jgi:hypothetical protein